MFFDEDHFAEALSPANAKLAAKVANEVIDVSGHVAYGEAMSGGELENFGSEKKQNDTHVAMVIGVKIMGTLRRRDVEVQREKISDKDLLRAYKERIGQLERLVGDDRGNA